MVVKEQEEMTPPTREQMWKAYRQLVDKFNESNSEYERMNMFPDLAWLFEKLFENTKVGIT